ncbi:MAG: hypothetical protein WC030_00790 [Candidatus Paceibacterota bacterium]
MKPSANTTLIILTVCIAAAGAFWYLYQQNAAESSLTPGAVQNQKQVEFQALVMQLQPISFDTSILSDENFLALQDIAAEIAREPLGRPDPFAPIAGQRAP